MALQLAPTVFGSLQAVGEGGLEEELETGDAIGEGTQSFVVMSHSKGLQHARVPLQSAPTVLGKMQPPLRADRAVENVEMLDPLMGGRRPLRRLGEAQRYVDLSHRKGLQHWPVWPQSAPTVLGRVHLPMGEGWVLEDVEVIDVIGKGGGIALPSPGHPQTPSPTSHHRGQQHARSCMQLAPKPLGRVQAAVPVGDGMVSFTNKFVFLVKGHMSLVVELNDVVAGMFVETEG